MSLFRQPWQRGNFNGKATAQRKVTLRSLWLGWSSNRGYCIRAERANNNNSFSGNISLWEISGGPERTEFCVALSSWDSLTSESVEGTSLALEGIDNIHRRDSFSLSMLGVGHGLTGPFYPQKTAPICTSPSGQPQKGPDRCRNRDRNRRILDRRRKCWRGSAKRESAEKRQRQGFSGNRKRETAELRGTADGKLQNRSNKPRKISPKSLMPRFMPKSWLHNAMHLGDIGHWYSLQFVWTLTFTAH